MSQFGLECGVTNYTVLTNHDMLDWDQSPAILNAILNAELNVITEHRFTTTSLK